MEHIDHQHDHKAQPNTHREIDPVCGMTVEPELAKGGSYEHAGTNFFFCSPRCRERFVTDPQKYLAKDDAAAVDVPAQAKALELQASVAVTAAREYTCPMHPEIVRGAPGACPICGMALEPRTVDAVDEESSELIEMRRRFWISSALTLPTFLLAMSEHIPGEPLRQLISPMLSAWLQLLLAAPVVAWGGWPFFQRGWASIVNRSLNMFTLIAIGTAAAFGFSVFALLFPSLLPHAAGHDHTAPLYFEAAAVIVTLVLLGQVLELRARHATSGAIRALLRLSPKTARRVRADAVEEDVPLDQVVVGDRLRVRPSETVCRPSPMLVIPRQSAVDLRARWSA